MSYYESEALLKFSPCIVAGAALLCAIHMIEGTTLLDTEMRAFCDICDVDPGRMELCKEMLCLLFFKHYAVSGKERAERAESPNDVMATLNNQPAFQSWTARCPPTMAPSKNHFSPVLHDANDE